MGWAFEHGSDDPEVLGNLIKFIFAHKFKISPLDVDKLDSELVESFMIWLGKLAKKNGATEDVYEDAI